MDVLEEGGSSDDEDFEELLRRKLLAKRAQQPSNRTPPEQSGETLSVRKLSKVGYKEYLREFDEVFESREGFSVQSNITGAILQAGRGLVKWVDIGTKAARVTNPGCPEEERYELRPCLKIAVHSLTATDNETRERIAEAVVGSIEKRHGKAFSSQDYDSWLDFIEAAVSQAGLLCDSHLMEESWR